jgi:hypothetical protein
MRHFFLINISKCKNIYMILQQLYLYSQFWKIKNSIIKYLINTK